MNAIKTIEDFTCAVKYALSEAFPECRIEAADVTKNNGVRLMGMTIHPKNKKIAPTIHMEPYFAALQSGCPFDTVIGQIIRDCTAALSGAETDIDADGITDFEQVKDRICYKLVGRSMNSGFLSEMTHRDYLDMAVIYYLPLAMTAGGLATVTVTDRLLKAWGGVDEKTLYKLAARNSPKINRGCVVPMTDVLGGLSGCPGTHESSAYGSFDFASVGDGELPMYVATNRYKTYGAGILLYDGFLETVSERLGSFYVLPSSVHELIIIPETFGSPDELKQMVKEINGAAVPAEEILTDSCYCYDSVTHELKIAA